jgi:hypothetical protein
MYYYVLLLSYHSMSAQAHVKKSALLGGQSEQGQSHIYLTREGVYKSYLISTTLIEAEIQMKNRSKK